MCTNVIEKVYSLCEEPRICISEHMCIIQSTNFSQRAPDPIPHHAYRKQEAKSGRNPLRAITNGIQSTFYPPYDTNCVFT